MTTGFRITRREQKILAMIVAARSNQEIADLLYIAPGTVILNPVDKSIKNCRVGIAHPTIAQLVFKDLFQPHSVSESITQQRVDPFLRSTLC
ncbi:MAG: LuxR C-terminal-related transcriptional regulator [Chroococcales cyanobacterium]